MNTLIPRRARVSVKVSRSDGAGEETESEYAFEDHRMTIKVSQGGGQFGAAKVRIFGVNLDSMNNIARLWLEVLSPSNTDTLTIEVWDGSNFVPFFEGVITWSAINASGAPAVALEIEANAAMIAQNTVAPPYSESTPVFLRDALSEILSPAGLEVEFADSVPEYQVQRVHVSGTPMEQAQTLLGYFPELAWYVNLQRLYVRNVNGPLGGDPVLLSKDTGLIGYPTYSTSGISVVALFDARLRPGLALDIQTRFDFVTRTKWVASVLEHSLQPNTPGGQWVSNVAAQSYGAKGNTEGGQT